MPSLSISDTKNQETQRKRINRLFLQYAPGYGSELPEVDETQPDGRIFYLNDAGFQLRNGEWVAL